jgi:uncharacterized protein YcfL
MAKVLSILILLIVGCSKQPAFLLCRSGKQEILINVNEIEKVLSGSSYTTIYVKNTNRLYRSDLSLREMERYLND